MSLLLYCKQCGISQQSVCECGVGHVTALEYAAIAVARMPEKTNRAIAAEIGVGEATIRRARVASNDATGSDRRIGQDGKSYKATKPKFTFVQDDPQELEQVDVYDSAIYLLDERMTAATRQKFLGYAAQKYGCCAAA